MVISDKNILCLVENTERIIETAQGQSIWQGQLHPANVLPSVGSLRFIPLEQSLIF